MHSRASKLTVWAAVLLLTPVGLYLLFADTLIKTLLAAQLTRSHGAEVNIGDFEHHLFPPHVVVKEVAFTDPSAPQYNQLEVGRLAGDVELMALFSNQLIMNQLDILDVAFNQPRPSPGKVLRQPEGHSFDELLSQAKKDLLTVDELLERSPLKTSAAVEQAKSTYDEYAQSLQDDYQALPDKERLNYYKAEIQALRKTDLKKPAELLKAKQTFEQLKEQIRADKEKIARFRANASKARVAMGAALEELQVAPQQDYALLKGVYAGDEAALSQLTEAVFGEQAARYNRYLFTAFDLLVPLLTGEDNAASTDPEQAAPLDVLIKQANVSVNWQDTLISGDWKNITNKHALFGDPTTFLLNATTKGAQAFSTEGQFVIDNNGLDASQTWQIAGVLLDNITLSSNARLDASLKQALLATTGTLTVTDNVLNGTGNIDLSELTMTASGSDNLTNIIASLLRGLSQLDMQMNIGGTLTAPSFGFSSDLDRQLTNAALSSLNDAQQGKLTELNTRLQRMADDQNNNLSNALGNVSTWLSTTQRDEAALQELLQATFKTAVEQQKDKLLNKLFDKLNGR